MRPIRRRDKVQRQVGLIFLRLLGAWIGSEAEKKPWGSVLPRTTRYRQVAAPDWRCMYLQSVKRAYSMGMMGSCQSVGVQATVRFIITKVGY